MPAPLPGAKLGVRQVKYLLKYLVIFGHTFQYLVTYLGQAGRPPGEIFAQLFGRAIYLVTIWNVFDIYLVHFCSKFEYLVIYLGQPSRNIV